MPQNKQKSDRILNGETQLQGWPGYRTRDNRSGLDPFDTRAEAAFMEGTFYRKLFTLKLRTRNTFHLILMFILGTVASIFMAVAFYGLISSPTYGEKDLTFYLNFAFIYLLFGFVLLVGFALLINFSINIAAILGWGRNGQELRSRNVREKKLPKRRKDYR